MSTKSENPRNFQNFSKEFFCDRPVLYSMFKTAPVAKHGWQHTVGRNKKQVQEYIKNQLQEDQIADQMSIKEYVDPFTGRENK